MHMLKKGLLVGGALSIALGAMMEPSETKQPRMFKTTRHMLRKGMRMMSLVKKIM